jgi:hypothetical protein
VQIQRVSEIRGPKLLPWRRFSSKESGIASGGKGN